MSLADVCLLLGALFAFATLILKVYHDLTHEEVAGILGSSIGTVKANLFHALGNLRKLLGPETGE